MFIALIDNDVFKDAHTSLKGICEAIGVSYSVASRGKRVFIDNQDRIIKIAEVQIIKVKGRGRNNFK